MESNTADPRSAVSYRHIASAFRTFAGPNAMDAAELHELLDSAW